MLCTCHFCSLGHQRAFAILCHVAKRRADSAVAINVFEAILRMTVTVLPQTVLISMLLACMLDHPVRSFCKGFDQLL